MSSADLGKTKDFPYPKILFLGVPERSLVSYMFTLAGQENFIFFSPDSYYEAYGLDQTFLKK